MIDVTWEGLPELQGKMKKARQFIDPGKIMLRECIMFTGHVKKEHFGRVSKGTAPVPGKLTMRSGSAGLGGSIKHEVLHKGGSVDGVVGVPKQSTAAKYAEMHERPASTMILPKKAKVLRITLWSGEVIFRPFAIVPGRPYFAPSKREFGPIMTKDWNNQVHLGLRKAGLL
jgi:hypothetical protein